MRPSTISGLSLLAALACARDAVDDPALNGEIPFSPARPAAGETTSAASYTGSNAHVREAQEQLATGYDLHAKVVYRTCSPNGGVCHNNKEYPDLRTPGNLLASIEAPCNVQPGTWDAVYDRCERNGDRLKMGDRDKDLEIGWIEYIPGEPAAAGEVTKTTPGLHVELADPIAIDRPTVDDTARFLRTFVNARGEVEQLVFAGFRTRWTILEGGTHLVGNVGMDRVSRVQELLSVGIVQGDHNRNGMFGARAGEPIPLIRPGKPEESYLIGRLRGAMAGVPIPGTRMPLANQPLSVPEMLALFCFVEGLTDANPNLASRIDYARCSYSSDPENLNLLGSGVTWARRVKQILDTTCVGCHSGTEPQGELDLTEGNVYARLLGPSKQRPELSLIQPRSPEQSYLWLKLTGSPSIVGGRMPLFLNGDGALKEAELRDIKAWIEAGAVENE